MRAERTKTAAAKRLARKPAEPVAIKAKKRLVLDDLRLANFTADFLDLIPLALN
jgi:hypothetical protein